MRPRTFGIIVIAALVVAWVLLSLIAYYANNLIVLEVR